MKDIKISVAQFDLQCQNLVQLLSDDLDTFLDGLPDEAITAVCQIVVDRVKEFKQDVIGHKS
jgi:hypothetical protein